MAQNKTSRNEKGISLATTLAIGTVSMMWVGAMAATIMPAYNRISITKCKNIARTCAETALDTVIGDLNRNFDAASGVSGSQYDAPALNSVTQRQVATATTSGLSVNTDVFVYNRFPGGPTTQAQGNFSSVFDQNLDSLANTEKQKYYRIVEARTKVGQFEKRVRAVLEPMFATNGQIVFPFAGFGDQGMTVVGRTYVDSYAPGVAANPLLDKLNAHLGSNVNTGHVGMNSYNYMRIGGNQYEFPNPVASQTAQLQTIGNQFNATLVSKAKWCQYTGSVYSNGSNTAHWPAQGTDFLPSNYVTETKWSSATAQDTNGPYVKDKFTSSYPDATKQGKWVTPGDILNAANPDGITHLDANGTSANGTGEDNVRGLNNTWSAADATAAGDPSLAGAWKPSTTQTSSGGSVYAPAPSDQRTLMDRSVETLMDYQKVKMVPAPSAPSGTPSLGAVALSGTAKVIFRSGASAPASYNVGARNSGTIILPPGDYKIPSMSLAGTSEFTVEPGVNVNLYVEGTSGSTMISSSKTSSFNAVSGASGGNLKIYSNKSSDVILNGNTKAVMYMPNARVFVGSGNDSNSNTSQTITNPDGSVVNFAVAGSGLTDLNYWGSVVGRETYFLANTGDANSHVRFHFDRTLIPPPTTFQFRVRPLGGSQPTFGPRMFSGWRAISYQEDPTPIN